MFNNFFWSKFIDISFNPVNPSFILKILVKNNATCSQSLKELAEFETKCVPYSKLTRNINCIDTTRNPLIYKGVMKNHVTSTNYIALMVIFISCKSFIYPENLG